MKKWSVHPIFIHEIGHAVIGHFIGMKIIRIAADKERCEGLCFEEIPTNYRGRHCPIKKAMYLMAGHEAEKFFFGKVLGWSDYDLAEIKKLSICKEELELLRLRVRSMINLRQGIISLLALNLQRQKKMTGDQFRFELKRQGIISTKSKIRYDK